MAESDLHIVIKQRNHSCIFIDLIPLIFQRLYTLGMFREKGREGVLAVSPNLSGVARITPYQ